MEHSVLVGRAGHRAGGTGGAQGRWDGRGTGQVGRAGHRAGWTGFAFRFEPSATRERTPASSSHSNSRSHMETEKSGSRGR